MAGGGPADGFGRRDVVEVVPLPPHVPAAANLCQQPVGHHQWRHQDQGIEQDCVHDREHLRAPCSWYTAVAHVPKGGTRVSPRRLEEGRPDEAIVGKCDHGERNHDRPSEGPGAREPAEQRLPVGARHPDPVRAHRHRALVPDPVHCQGAQGDRLTNRHDVHEEGPHHHLDELHHEVHIVHTQGQCANHVPTYQQAVGQLRYPLAMSRGLMPTLHITSPEALCRGD
mmetsp:Transcript_158788/g.505559  ORF Transcript_158788/g.505559 Transcript_158788/m.505559 type:complete len:226 (+) Transcript_158788:45-722(+)